MTKVAGIRFSSGGKIYYFDPGELLCTEESRVVVETVRGIEMGWVATAPREINEEAIVAPLRKVVRMATDEDVSQYEENKVFEKEAVETCSKKILDHKLDMKLVNCEYAFDRSKLIFYFTSGGRVDFRELVKVLAQIFKTRIELRQIGVRDEAKMLGGIGSCGNEICCCRFLSEFQPVTIRMARDQGLSLNPTKISGLCGRLMCCLKYEQDNYEYMRAKMPRQGSIVTTPDGDGHVIDVNIFHETVKVNNGEVREYPLADVARKAPPEKNPQEKNRQEKT